MTSESSQPESAHRPIAAQHELVRREPAPFAPLAEPRFFDESPPENEPSSDLSWLWGAFRRRWKTALLSWVLLAAPALAGIWLLLKPSYTASATLEFSPPTLDNFMAIVNTQAELIVSPNILRSALDDPRLQSLDLKSLPDPVAALRRSVSAEHVPSTYVVNVSSTLEDREAAVHLTAAVVEAYIKQEVEHKTERNRQEKQDMDDQLAACTSRIKEIEAEIAGIVERQHGASQNKGLAERRALLQADLNHLTIWRNNLKEELYGPDGLNRRLQLLDKGIISDEDATTLDARRREFMENDPEVRSKLKEIEAETDHLTKIQRIYAPTNPEVERVVARLQKLNDDLDQNRAEAERAFDEQLNTNQEERVKKRRERWETQRELAEKDLADVNRQIDELQKRVDALNEADSSIETLARTRDEETRRLHLFEERIEKANEQRARQPQVTVAAEPMLRAKNGVQDKRKKLSAVALMGTLVLAFAAALLRDRLDARLQEAGQVERAMGLRLLGTVPSVHD